VDVISPVEQKLGQVATILTGDPSNERSLFRHRYQAFHDREESTSQAEPLRQRASSLRIMAVSIERPARFDNRPRPDATAVARLAG
jgi:hypothetical protein